MNEQQPHRIMTIDELLQLRDLPNTQHPLISVLNIAALKEEPKMLDLQVTTDFYFIAMSQSTKHCLKLEYGREPYDFNKGVMSFIAPGRTVSFNGQEAGKIIPSGWLILLHPDFLWNSTLASKIKQYDFFDYKTNESLFLSDKEEQIMDGLFKQIESEYKNSIDQYSQGIIIPLIESVLAYSERFYHRQFITRKIKNHAVVHQLEEVLKNAFSKTSLKENGIPTVKEVSSLLNTSPNYLSTLLKIHTGNSTQQHIQEKVINLAKEQLVTTDLSVNQIAYDLGFDYPQSFSKLFKTKTNTTPLEFRNATRT